MADLDLQRMTPVSINLPPETRTLIQVTEMSARLERLFIHDQQHVAALRELQESSARLEERGKERAAKLEELEALIAQQTAWKAKLGGVWMGIALTITTLASIAALLKNFVK